MKEMEAPVPGAPDGDSRAELARETLAWCKDWREGMFSPAHTDDGWTVEMHGLVESAERHAADVLALETELADSLENREDISGREWNDEVVRIGVAMARDVRAAVRAIEDGEPASGVGEEPR